MDYLRLTPRPKVLIVSKISGDEERELMRIPVTTVADIEREEAKLVHWAMTTAVGLEIPHEAQS